MNHQIPQTFLAVVLANSLEQAQQAESRFQPTSPNLKQNILPSTPSINSQRPERHLILSIEMKHASNTFTDLMDVLFQSIREVLEHLVRRFFRRHQSLFDKLDRALTNILPTAPGARLISTTQSERGRVAIRGGEERELFLTH